MADTDHDHDTSVGAHSARRARRRRASALLATVIAGATGLAAMPSSPVAACDSLAIPSLALQRCVVAGDQPEIDAGNVVRVDRLSSQYVHWVAGHRTSHGATFISLTNLSTGALVGYRGTTYSIVDYRLVDRFHPDSIYPWMDATTPSLVLQTSAHDSYVHVWRALPASGGAMQLSAVPVVDDGSSATIEVGASALDEPAEADVVAISASVLGEPADVVVVDAAVLDDPADVHVSAAPYRGRGPRWALMWV